MKEKKSLDEIRLDVLTKCNEPITNEDGSTFVVDPSFYSDPTHAHTFEAENGTHSHTPLTENYETIAKEARRREAEFKRNYHPVEKLAEEPTPEEESEADRILTAIRNRKAKNEKAKKNSNFDKIVARIKEKQAEQMAEMVDRDITSYLKSSGKDKQAEVLEEIQEMYRKAVTIPSTMLRQERDPVFHWKK